ncbi:lysosomal Pro-Xaa carboxypeptidase [Ranunculus cassubicifolius]
MSLKLSFPWLLMLLLASTTSAKLNNVPRLGIRWKNNPFAKPATPRKIVLDPVYYTQTLDHFNYGPNSNTTFPQRYLINSDFWGGAKTKSPIFAYLGAEQPISDEALAAGFVFDIAPKFKALIVFIEHRYYGESAPFGSLEKAFDDINSLGYFTSTQALADYAEVIVSLKKNLSAEGSPVIVFGGSYGGMLASWFRLKYPHVAMGALGSSAPILYFEELTPIDQFFVTISNDFKEASMNCYNTIKQSWAIFNKTASQKNGLLTLSKKFNTCTRLKSLDELYGYFENLYIKSAQYDAPPSYPVNQLCSKIDSISKNTSDILNRMVSIVPKENCLNLTGDEGVDFDNLGWRWQRCTDVLFPLGINNDNTMFPPMPFTYEELIENCREIFGVTPRLHWTLTEFGGRDIKHVLKKFGSNIIFSNGLRDTWSRGGVLETISDSVVAVVTKYGSHCLDLAASTEDDPKWLTHMRDAEVKIMKGWLAEYYRNT